MKRYVYDKLGVFIKEIEADTYPRRSTKTKPPELQEGEYAIWAGTVWTVVSEKPEYIPQRVNSMQAELAMETEGIIDDVEAYINGLDKNDHIRRAYNRTNYFVYGHPMIKAIQVALGLTDEQVDNLFITAGKIQ